MSTLYSIGHMNQLGDAFEAEGFTSEDVTRLKQFNGLADIKSVINGTAKIKPVSEDSDSTRWITINETTIAVYLGASPNLPFDGARVEHHIGEGWVIIEKRADGLYINGRNVILHLSKRQKGRKWLKGYELRKELTGKPVLNANILDTLYQNPHIIPDDWKKDENGNNRFIFFWGTIYCDLDGNLFIRCLCFRGGVWHRRYFWLVSTWHGLDPAVLLAS